MKSSQETAIAAKTRPLSELACLKPRELREAIRRGEWTQRMHGLGVGYTMANLAVLPYEYAYDFLLFCQRNHLPCPVMEVMDKGAPIPQKYAPSADLRTDL